MNEKLILENQHAIMKALSLMEKGDITTTDYDLLKYQIVETEDYLKPVEQSLPEKTKDSLRGGDEK